MFGLALTIATAQERTVAAIEARAGAVKRWGGRVLLIVGAWFVALGVFADAFARLFPV